MNKLAFIYGDTLIYWSSVVTALAVLTGILLFLGTYTLQTKKIAGGFLACPIAIVLSLILARLIHWYFRSDSYGGFDTVIALSSDGYALSGAFAGCLLTALLLKLTNAVDSLPHMLDCMSIGGAAAIGIGRLSCFFTADDRGWIVSPELRLPWAYPMTDAATGAEEYRFATFLLQAIIAGCIFVILLIAFYGDPKGKKRRDGDITFLFLLLYCASQAVLDSTRYDALHLRLNGFINFVQVLCAVVLAAVIGLLSARGIRESGWRGWYPAVWLVALIGIGGAGYMEYFVQRHGDRALFSYLVMGGCLAAAVLMGMFLLLRTRDGRSPGKRPGGRYRAS